MTTTKVWTARLSTRDPDAFNVTRKSGDPVFAPSWALLRTALEVRRTGRGSTDDEWRAYARAYLAEMDGSYKANRPAWDALLGLQRVVLTCYCVNPERCHRKLLGLVLGRLGADFRGELPAAPPEESERDIYRLAMELGD